MGCAADGAPCGGCAMRARALRGDPAARKLLAPSSAPATIGGILPEVVWPSDVEKFKNRLDPAMAATDAAVGACPSLGEGERAAWKGFYGAWRTFFATPVPWMFGASTEWDNTVAFEATLAGWQGELRKKCDVPGPVIKPDEGPDLSAVKWAAAAVVAVAVVYGVKSILP